MLTYTEKLLGMKIDRKGQRRLSNKVFANLKADEFVLGPAERWDDDYIVEDCVFSNCVSKPGPLLVLPGVQLYRVIFDNMRTVDTFRISRDALLDHVTVRGQPKSAGLWITSIETAVIRDTPLRSRIAELASAVEVMLDISQFEGESVEILGLPAEKVVINKDRHVVIRRSTKVDWKKLGISKHSNWWHCWRRLEISELDVGIYDIPLRETDEEAYREFSVLRNEALL